MTIENVPTKENPATGEIVSLSVIETLRGLVSPFRVGTWSIINKLIISDASLSLWKLMY